MLVLSCTMGEAARESLTGGDLHCVAGMKQCGSTCVAMDRPSTGCSATTCEPCQVPHASATCSGGTCVPSACEFGWKDCDRDPANGCETETESCGCRSVEFSTPNTKVVIKKLVKSEAGALLDVMDFQDGDWTWEAWLKVKGEEAAWQFYSNGEGHENNGFGVGIGASGIYCGVQMSGNPAPAAGMFVEGLLRPNEWQHLACERSGNTLRLYVDGVLRSTVTAFDVTSVSDATMYRGPSLTDSPVLLGPMRISKAARYDGNFEPWRRWSADPDTVVLYLVSKGMKEQTLADEAGEPNNGSVSGGVVDGQGDTPCAEAGE